MFHKYNCFLFLCLFSRLNFLRNKIFVDTFAEDAYRSLADEPGIATFMKAHPEQLVRFLKFGTEGIMANMLNHNYFSEASVMYGDKAARYRITPCSDYDASFWSNSIFSGNLLSSNLKKDMLKVFGRIYSLFLF